MNRIKTFPLLAMGLAFGLLTGCSKPVKTESAKNELVVCTSFYPVYVMTLNIARDVPGVRVVNMTRPTAGCLHGYQLTPANLKTLAEADVFVINGGGMESFMEKVAAQMPKLKIVDASRGIELLEEERHECKDHAHHHHHHHHGEKNSHVWVSITGAIRQAQNIAESLAQLDPARAQAYQNNAQVYVERLETLRERMKRELAPIQNRNIITFHEAFPYFAQEFDLNIVDVIEREPGNKPSAKELAETIEKIKKQNVKALFAEPQYPSLSAEVIARETGLRVFFLDPVATGTMEAPAVYDAYITAMEKNLAVLLEALK